MKEGNPYDTIVIGAGQAGLASAYYLQRAGSQFLVLDGASQIGESWRRRWDSLRLFTPVRISDALSCRCSDPKAIPSTDAASSPPREAWASLDWT